MHRDDTEHDGPRQPGSHAHTPGRTQRPCGALQPAAHSGTQQSTPPHPGWHVQSTGSPSRPGDDARHVECAWISLSHVSHLVANGRAGAAGVPGGARQRRPVHEAPPHGAWQSHTPGATQVPRPWQSPAQLGFWQSAPAHPDSHAHTPGAVHRPRPCLLYTSPSPRD